MLKSSGTILSADFTGGKVQIDIQDGCNRIKFKCRKTTAVDADSYADGIFINVDALHEDPEPGYPLQKGETIEFITLHDHIKKVIITAANVAAIPTIDFGVTGREKTEE